MLGDDKTPVHFEGGKWVTLIFISNICQGNRYLGLLTTESEVSPLGPVWIFYFEMSGKT